MWLAVLGASLTVIWTLQGTHIGNTKYCTYVGFQPYGSSSNIAIAVFDTCVFVAISWRLLADAPSDGGKRTSDSGILGLFGRYLPHFSRALLKDGQKYYLYVACTLHLAAKLIAITTHQCCDGLQLAGSHHDVCPRGPDHI